eukprot:g3037.t1
MSEDGRVQIQMQLSGGSLLNEPMLSASSANSHGGHGGGIHNSLGTFNGVYIPCCLNILGIILFQRLSWAVGQGGVIGVFQIFALAECMAILTVLSFSAIVTNGNMSGGGSYFMISRSLGPEFGGAIGLLFYLAYAIGVAFYCSGFALVVQQTFFPADEAVIDGVVQYDVGTVKKIVGSIGLFSCAIVSYIGAGVFARFNIIFFVLQVAAIIIGIISYSFFPLGDLPNGTMKFPMCVERASTLSETVQQQCLGYKNYDPPYTGQASVYGLGWQRLKENFYPDYSFAPRPEKGHEDTMCGNTVCGFHYVFAIIFPAATGIMEGANLSGDLKDPAKSIPTGTLAAIFTAICTYAVLTISMAASFDRDTLRYELGAYQKSTIGLWPLVGGILISSLSSGLGSLFGGARVLQAIARDDLFPAPLSLINIFKTGSVDGDEPRRAVLFTWFIAQSCLFVGSLDILAGVLTSFFCLSYALCNLTCFALEITGAPNFRPTFKYYSWHTALAGFAVNIGVMFWLDPTSAVMGVGCLSALFTIIYLHGPVKEWGDVSQALMFHQVRKYMLKLSTGDEAHEKFWRPSYLLLSDSIGTHDLIDFCEYSKKGGIFVAGSVMVGAFKELSRACRDRRTVWTRLLRVSRVKAFPQITTASTVRIGTQYLLNCGGFGAMDVNSVVIPFSSVAAHGRGGKGRRESEESKVQDNESNNGKMRSRLSSQTNMDLEVSGACEFVGIINDSLWLQRNVVLAANFERRSSKVKQNRRPGSCIDVWINTAEVLSGTSFRPTQSFNFADSSSFSLQLGHILSRNQRFCKNSTLRLFAVVPTGLAKEPHGEYTAVVRNSLLKQLQNARIYPSVVRVLIVNTPLMGDEEGNKGGGSPQMAAKTLNGIMREISGDACLLLMGLPTPPEPEAASMDSSGNRGNEEVSKAEAEGWIGVVDTATRGLPPTACTRYAQQQRCITDAI